MESLLSEFQRNQFLNIPNVIEESPFHCRCHVQGLTSRAGVVVTRIRGARQQSKLQTDPLPKTSSRLSVRERKQLSFDVAFVAAASVNPVDCKRRAGLTNDYYPIRFPGLIGVDMSGIVIEIGPGVEVVFGWQPSVRNGKQHLR